MTKFYWELDKAARRILEAISLALSLTKDERYYLINLHSGHNNQLRLLHYPPIPTEKLHKQVMGRMLAFNDWRYVHLSCSLPSTISFSAPLTLGIVHLQCSSRMIA